MNQHLKKAVSASIITACVFAGPLGIIAKAEGAKEKGENAKSKTEVTRQIDKSVKEKVKPEIVKKEINNMIGKEDVKRRFEKAKELQKMEEYQKLLLDIKKAKLDLEEIRSEVKNIRVEMQDLIRKSYTEKELSLLKQAAKEIEKKNPKTKVISVENILTKKGKFKFDTPPVIKDGRTLIPVRAITEGLGANVAWNAEERKVIVSKGEVEIIFQLEDGKVFVNGEERAIDVPAQLMNNRTVVPLRFIAENLGLKVDYDKDTDVIEIDEETEEEQQASSNTDETVVENDEQNNQEAVVEEQSQTPSENGTSVQENNDASEANTDVTDNTSTDDTQQENTVEQTN